jgi:hypothetical protein
LILPIPVLLHLTGSVLDEDAPFGNTVLHAIHVVTGDGDGLAWQLQRAY